MHEWVSRCNTYHMQAQHEQGGQLSLEGGQGRWSTDGGNGDISVTVSH